MKVHRSLIAALLMLGVASAAVGTAAATTKKLHPAAATTLIIGNEGFTESYIMQDIYGDLLQNAGFKVSLLAQASSTRQEAIPALEAGSVDVLPDYAGSLLVYLAPKDQKQAGNITTAEAT